MADIINEIDFAMIDNEIETVAAVRKNAIPRSMPIDKPSTILEWDTVPSELPPKLTFDWGKFNKSATGYNGFDWSKYKSNDVDEFLTFDDDFDTPDLKPLPSTGSKSSSVWWDDPKDSGKKHSIYSGDIEVEELYDMMTELQVRVDKISSDLDDLTDTVKAQYSDMNKMLRAIHEMVATSNSIKPQ